MFNMIDVIVVFFGVYLWLWDKFSWDKAVEPWKEPLLAPWPTLCLLIIPLFTGYVIISWTNLVPIKRKQLHKTLILIAILLSTVGLDIITQMYLRHQNGPLFVHDAAIQLEEGVKFLLAGKNPYSEDYSDTPLADWPYYKPDSNQPFTNPAIKHLVYLPTLLYLGAMPYVLITNLFNWFDYRILNILFLFIAGIALFMLFDHPKNKLAALTILSLSPLFYPFISQGVNDIIVLSLILCSLALLHRKLIVWSLVIMALAVTAKHTAWFILPFYFFWLFQQKYLMRKNWLQLTIFPLTILITLLPFILWNWYSFIEDTWLNLSGSLPTSYPIDGYSIGVLLIHLGIINTHNDYFPFWIFQLFIVAPLLFFLLRQQKKTKPSIGHLMLNYGLLLGVT